MSSGKKAKKQRQNKKAVENNRPSLSSKKQLFSLSSEALLSLVMISAIGLLVYSSTFNSPFMFDDRNNILGNTFIRVSHISIDELGKVLKAPVSRFMAYLTFAFNYYFHQYDETGYHFVNITIHIITAFLLYLVTRKTMILCRLKNTWLAIPVVLLWLVNPVHTQSVTYIVQRMNALAAMFYLLAMFCYIQGRLAQREDGSAPLRFMLFFAASALAGLCGMLSKEITATLPVMIFLYEWYFFQAFNTDWIRRQIRWIFFVCIILIAFCLVYVKAASLQGGALTALTSLYAEKQYTMGQRLLTEASVIIYYLSLLLFPSPDRLQMIYQITPAKSLVSPISTLLSFIALAGIISFALLLRRRHKLVSFAIIWFLVNLVIESSFIPLALAYEHRTYLPSMFIFAALATLLPRSSDIRATQALLIGTIILFSCWTWQRNAVWTDRISFWKDTTMKAPQDPTAINNLGLAYYENGDLETALTHFKAAVELNPDHEKSYNNIGSVLLDLKRPEEAVKYLNIAVNKTSDLGSAYHNLGVAYSDLGQIKKAESSYAKALELTPFSETIHNKVGIIKMNRGAYDEAMNSFNRALEINPLYEQAYINMGIACFRQGESDRALSLFKKALAINPNSADAARNLNDVRNVIKQYGQTIIQLQQAIQQNPKDSALTFKLAKFCRHIGMKDYAVALYDQTLRLNPGCTECIDNLAGIYESTGRYEQAAEMLEKLALIFPEKPNIFYGLARIYAQNDQKEKAVENLRQSVAKGLDGIDTIRNDKALKAIRDTVYFQNLTAGRQ